VHHVKISKPYLWALSLTSIDWLEKFFQQIGFLEQLWNHAHWGSPYKPVEVLMKGGQADIINEKNPRFCCPLAGPLFFVPYVVTHLFLPPLVFRDYPFSEKLYELAF
jgi:hypothetical protein